MTIFVDMPGRRRPPSEEGVSRYAKVQLLGILLSILLVLLVRDYREYQEFREQEERAICALRNISVAQTGPLTITLPDAKPGCKWVIVSSHSYIDGGKK